MWEKARAEFIERIFTLNNSQDFESAALDLFHLQSRYNAMYSRYLELLRVNPDTIQHTGKIPFLPIELFKSHEIKTGEFAAAEVFTSSGTTGQQTSSHYVREPQWYTDVYSRIFRMFYGNPTDWCIAGLLPSYLERRGSSLVYMTDGLIRQSGKPDSGFFLKDMERLASLIQSSELSGQPTLLIGVTFALLDFAEAFPMPLRHTVIMETGGMKGRREEMTREEVHERLGRAFGLDHIHSEYGMTELMSQAYSNGQGIFRTPGWMSVRVREPNDPLSESRLGRSGALNIIDLANVDSCAFIATSDVGEVRADGSFRVLGRFDHSDIRGCNLLIA